MHKLITSPVVVALVAFVLVNLAVRQIRPLHGIALPYTFWDQHPLAFKFDHVSAAPAAPDVAFIGSSLVLAANCAADAAFERRAQPVLDDEYYCYGGASYLAEKLRCYTGVRMDAVNFGCPGCMVADAVKIVEELARLKRLPKVIVYGIAPRDFVARNTCVYQKFFQSRSEGLAIRRFSEPDLSRLAERAFHLYDIRADYQYLLTRALAALDQEVDRLASGRGIDGNFPKLMGLKNKTADSISTPEALERDLEHYKGHYQDCDKEAVNKQKEQFRQLSGLCRKYNVMLFVVNMPLSEENKMVMPPGFLQEYRSFLQSLCAEAGLTYFDIESRQRFSRSDFRDSVHLRSSGALRAIDAIAAEIARRPEFSAIGTGGQFQ